MLGGDPRVDYATPPSTDAISCPHSHAAPMWVFYAVACAIGLRAPASGVRAFVSMSLALTL
jgi:hypothetical protein